MRPQVIMCKNFQFNIFFNHCAKFPINIINVKRDIKALNSGLYFTRFSNANIFPTV